MTAGQIINVRNISYYYKNQESAAIQREKVEKNNVLKIKSLT